MRNSTVGRSLEANNTFFQNLELSFKCLVHFAPFVQDLTAVCDWTVSVYVFMFPSQFDDRVDSVNSSTQLFEGTKGTGYLCLVQAGSGGSGLTNLDQVLRLIGWTVGIELVGHVLGDHEG